MMHRREAVKWMGAAALIALAGPVIAEDQGLIRIIVPYAAGGFIDTIARLLAASMQTTLNRNVIVENKPGAAALIGTKFVQLASPDGNTLLFNASGMIALPMVQKSATYDPIKDFDPVCEVGETPSYLMVNDRVPANNMTEFLAWAHSTTDRIECGNAGINTGGHLLAQMLEKLAKIKLVHVPFKGAAEVTLAMIGGEVKMSVLVTTEALNPYIKEGKIKILGVTTKTRSSLLPDVPPIADTVPGYEYVGWYGILSPAHTPLDVRQKIASAVETALKDPTVKQRVEALYFEIGYKRPDQFAALLQESTDTHRKLVSMLGITPL